MIKSFEIHNFRCFEKTKLSGFGRINLIGGKNNSGKTVLLEAIYLSCLPQPESITFLRRLRRESLPLLKAYPERAWDNFFFRQDKKNLINLRLEQEEQATNLLLLWSDSDKDIYEVFEDGTESSGDLIDLNALWQNRNASKSTLYVCQKENAPSPIIVRRDALFLMTAHSKGILSKSKDGQAPALITANFVPVSFTWSNPTLAQEYDNAYLQGHADKVLQAIQVIDHSIIDAKTLSLGEPMLYLKRKGEIFLPVSLFGEAINKVVDLLVRLVNNPGAILLIDEIENGIHHTNQREFWRILFKLSIEFGTQIFLTTHSLEMIEAFRDVGLEAGNEEVGAYFELARNIRTGRISGVKHKLTTLDYELKRKKAVRGE